MKLEEASAASAVGEPRPFLQPAKDSNLTPTILTPVAWKDKTKTTSKPVRLENYTDNILSTTCVWANLYNRKVFHSKTCCRTCR